MEMELPREPLILNFNPEHSEVDTGVLMVFRDEVAKSLWLLIKAGHLTNQHFPEWCIYTAMRIRATNPRTPQDLFLLFRGTNFAFGGGFFLGTWEDNGKFLTRILQAVTGERPVKYKVILPSSPENIKRQRALHRLGRWHGLLGQKRTRHGKSYEGGFFAGTMLRRRIREFSELNIRLG